LAPRTPAAASDAADAEEATRIVTARPGPPSVTPDDPDADISEERTIAYDASAFMRDLRNGRPPTGPVPKPSPAPVVPSPVPAAVRAGAPIEAGSDPSDPLDATEEFNARGYALPSLRTGPAAPVPPPTAAPLAADPFAPVPTGAFSRDPAIGVYGSVDAEAIEEIQDEDVQAESPAAGIGAGGAIAAASSAPGLVPADGGFADDPANNFFADELAEAELLIQRGLLEAARDLLNKVREEVAVSPRIDHMMARIAARTNGEPEPPGPWEQQLLDDVANQLNELDGLSPPGHAAGRPDQISVEEVLSQFKRGVAETVADDDASTHFDLGIAYREMGLLDDAVGEFEIAARSLGRAADAFYVIALVRAEQGRNDDALAALTRALAAPQATTAQRAAAEFQRGVVLETAGHGRDAVVAFKRSRALGTATAELDRRLSALVAIHGDVAVDDAVAAKG
jgi:tetratricopeptide (TPR) repeat protein